jgi:hypothetical protein
VLRIGLGAKANAPVSVPSATRYPAINERGFGKSEGRRKSWFQALQWGASRQHLHFYIYIKFKEPLGGSEYITLLGSGC